MEAVFEVAELDLAICAIGPQNSGQCIRGYPGVAAIAMGEVSGKKCEPEISTKSRGRRQSLITVQMIIQIWIKVGERSTLIDQVYTDLIKQYRAKAYLSTKAAKRGNYH